MRRWEWRYLWQLCQADESVQAATGFRVPSAQVAVSKDGKAAGGETGGDKVALWDLTTKRPMTALPVCLHPKPWPSPPPATCWPWALAMRPDNRRLNCGTCSAGKLTQHAQPPKLPVRSLAFSPDGKLLATFDNQGNIEVVDWASDRTLTNFTVPPPRRGGAGVVVFSPDGNRLAIGEDYGRVQLLNLRTGTVVPLTNLTPNSEGVSALVFSPDRRTARGRLCDQRGLASGTPTPGNLGGN